MRAGFAVIPTVESAPDVVRPAAYVGAASVLVLASAAATSIVAASLYGATRESDAYVVARALAEVPSAVIGASVGLGAIPLLVRSRQRSPVAHLERVVL